MSTWRGSSPKVSRRGVVVTTMLVEPSVPGASWTTSPATVRETTECHVDAALQSLMGRSILGEPGYVTEERVTVADIEWISNWIGLKITFWKLWVWLVLLVESTLVQKLWIFVHMLIDVVVALALLAVFVLVHCFTVVHFGMFSYFILLQYIICEFTVAA